MEPSISSQVSSDEEEIQYEPLSEYISVPPPDNRDDPLELEIEDYLYPVIDNSRDYDDAIFNVVIIGGRDVGKKTLANFKPVLLKLGLAMRVSFQAESERIIVTFKLPEDRPKNYSTTKEEQFRIQFTIFNVQCGLEDTTSQELNEEADMYIFMFALTKASSTVALQMLTVMDITIPAILVGNKDDLDPTKMDLLFNFTQYCDLCLKLNCKGISRISTQNGIGVAKEVWSAILENRKDWMSQEKRVAQHGTSGSSGPCYPAENLHAPSQNQIPIEIEDYLTQKTDLRMLDQTKIFHAVIFGGENVGKKALWKCEPFFVRKGQTIICEVMSSSRVSNIIQFELPASKPIDTTREEPFSIKFSWINVQKGDQDGILEELIRSATIYIFLFDLTQPSSLQALEKLTDLNPLTPAILIGNKMDLTEKQWVGKKAINKLNKTLNCSQYGKISATTGQNVMRNMWHQIIRFRFRWIIKTIQAAKSQEEGEAAARHGPEEEQGSA